MSFKFYYLFIALLLLISNSSFAEKALILSSGVVYPPMQSHNGEGFTNLVLKEALNRIGYKIAFRVLPNERSLISSNKGLSDGELHRTKGMEKTYPNLIRVPEKLMDWKFVVFSKQDINTKQGWNSLKPYVTSFITGWKIFEYNVPKDVKISKVRSPDGLFTLLDKERTDIALYELWQGLELIKKHNYKDIKVSYPPLANKAMFTYLHKKHAHLVPKLAQSLKEMKKDGTYERLYQKILAPTKQ